MDAPVEYATKKTSGFSHLARLLSRIVFFFCIWKERQISKNLLDWKERDIQRCLGVSRLSAFATQIFSYRKDSRTVKK